MGTLRLLSWNFLPSGAWFDALATFKAAPLTKPWSGWGILRGRVERTK